MSLLPVATLPLKLILANIGLSPLVGHAPRSWPVTTVVYPSRQVAPSRSRPQQVYDERHVTGRGLEMTPSCCRWSMPERELSARHEEAEIPTSESIPPAERVGAPHMLLPATMPSRGRHWIDRSRVSNSIVSGEIGVESQQLDRGRFGCVRCVTYFFSRGSYQQRPYFLLTMPLDLVRRPLQHPLRLCRACFLRQRTPPFEQLGRGGIAAIACSPGSHQAPRRRSLHVAGLGSRRSFPTRFDTSTVHGQAVRLSPHRSCFSPLEPSGFPASGDYFLSHRPPKSEPTGDYIPAPTSGSRLSRVEQRPPGDTSTAMKNPSSCSPPEPGPTRYVERHPVESARAAPTRRPAPGRRARRPRCHPTARFAASSPLLFTPAASSLTDCESLCSLCMISAVTTTNRSRARQEPEAMRMPSKRMWTTTLPAADAQTDEPTNQC